MIFKRLILKNYFVFIMDASETLETDPNSWEYKEKTLNALMSKFKFTTLQPVERKKRVSEIRLLMNILKITIILMCFNFHSVFQI